MARHGWLVAVGVFAASACNAKDKAKPGGKDVAPAAPDARTAARAPSVDAAPLPVLADDPGTGDGAPAWGLAFGGLGEDVARDVTIAPGKGVVLCGDFEHEAKLGALGDRTAVGKSDGFVMLIDADGAPAWVTTIGGKNEDTCEGVAVGADGAIAFGGLYSDVLKLDGVPEINANGADDLYVAILEPDGRPRALFGTGGEGSDNVLTVAATPDGGFVAGGFIHGKVPFGDVELQAEAYEDAFLVKLAADGAVQWAKRYGGDRNDRFMRIAVDGQGSIYALAQFEGKPSFGGDRLESQGGFDIAVVKLTPDGDHVWSRGFGGQDNDGALGLAVDPAGNVTFAGSFDKTLTIEGVEHTAMGTSDILIVRFNADGTIAWSKSMGARGEDVGAAAAADAAGNVVVAGWFEKEVDLGKGKAVSAGNKDAFALKLDRAGNVRWVQTFGDRDHDKVRAAAIDADGNAYVAGVFRFKLKQPALESVRADGERAPKTDGYVIRLGR
jgi:hypothetical protein